MQFTSSTGTEAAVSLNVDFFDENGAIINVNRGTGTRTGEVPENAEKFRCFLSIVSGTTIDTVVYPQLELGPSATPYELEASLWEPFAEEGGIQQKALIEVAKSLLSFANNEEMKILNAQFADTGVAIRIGNLYVVIAQGPERTEDNLEIVTTKEIPLKANDPQVCLLKTRVGHGNGEFIHNTINIPGQDPSFYIRTGSTPNGYELLFAAYIV